MQAFHLTQPATCDAASRRCVRPKARCIIAGGTDLMQLTKDNVETPTGTGRSGASPLSRIQATDGLRLGALARMSRCRRTSGRGADWPVLSPGAAGLCLAAGAQHGHDGRQPAAADAMRLFPRYWFRLQQAHPGSGCPAIAGENRLHAILGASDHCIAAHASDWRLH